MPYGHPVCVVTPSLASHVTSTPSLLSSWGTKPLAFPAHASLPYQHPPWGGGSKPEAGHCWVVILR